MANVRSAVWRLLQVGRISPAMYRLLTGLAMAVVAYALWSVRSDDRAAGPVALVFLVGGIVAVGTAVKALRSSSASR